MQRNIFSVPSKHLLSLIFDTKFSELQQSAVLSVVDSISQIPGGLLTTLDFFLCGIETTSLHSREEMRSSGVRNQKGLFYQFYQ